MTVKARTKSVFLSYSHGDPVLAAEVTNCLSEEGWQIRGVGRELPDAYDFAVQIREAIKECDVFVVLATPAWAWSPWCVLEAGVAYGQQKPILVVTKDLPDEALPPYLEPFARISAKKLQTLVQKLRQVPLED